MESFLLPVISLSLICGVLAALLVIFDKYLNNYGVCKIVINKGAKELSVNGGDTILSSLKSKDIFVPSACGGRGSCGLCKLKVNAGVPPILATEEPHLTVKERAENIRLCCQLKIREDIDIEIPEELFNIKEYKTRVSKIVDLNHDIKLLQLEMLDGAEINIIPGQYMQFEVPKYKTSNETVYRAYSIASDPLDKKHVSLCIRYVPNGISTTYIFKYLKEGDRVVCNGPHGHFKLTDTDKDAVFIAGGSGMAPFLSMLAHVKNEGITRRINYFYGARSKRDLICLDEMAFFEKEIPTFKFYPSLSQALPEDNWTGETDLVTEVVKKYCPDLHDTEAYLCGSPGMIDASIAALVLRGMPEENIFYDKF